MQRLGQNQGGYRGERIDIDVVLAAIRSEARRYGWEEETLSVEARPVLALRRHHRAARANVYLSSGIHGDEPAGPLAIRHLLAANAWPEDVALWVCPCLNAEGFRRNSREDEHGIDLNRDYRHLTSEIVRAHVRWLEKTPAFDVALCLHEDWEAHGFYLYELNPNGRPSLADAIIRRVAAVCPIDPSPVIEGREAQGGIIRPSPDPASRPQWPEAFYLLQNKTRLSYTLEAPSDFPLATRVHALVEGVTAALRELPRVAPA
ncbi:MAG TPA: M14 family metallocarboxypeptidase [Methylomirabilota bacterium]|nr:M14 family metallocarboxypeptidase [Methylomirabilota bacterium]